MPAVATIVDNFDAGTINTSLWTGNYGTVSQVGGRARVACTTDYSGFQSASAYTLAGSSVYVRVYPPAAGGATVDAWAQVKCLSGTAGTEIGFLINAATNKIRCVSNVAYWDATAVELTYDAAAHAYVRLSEAGGTVTWATSPDGTAWTTRRTLATPAWVTSSTTIALLLEAHRDAGTVDVAEFDNCNTLPAPPVDSGGAVKAAFLAFL
ncbi:hypothetical protein [Streptomyces sp. HYC2]|uniref:hypothetical protein n=1 Tax=Streptomyces sp. HYC2 TaxID=2955207 RepID=UPI0024817FB1|nr:hypothetical protein [Streptomyces sp. HYC2]